MATIISTRKHSASGPATPFPFAKATKLASGIFVKGGGKRDLEVPARIMNDEERKAQTESPKRIREFESARDPDTEDLLTPAAMPRRRSSESSTSSLSSLEIETPPPPPPAFKLQKPPTKTNGRTKKLAKVINGTTYDGPDYLAGMLNAALGADIEDCFEMQRNELYQATVDMDGIDDEREIVDPKAMENLPREIRSAEGWDIEELTVDEGVFWQKFGVAFQAQVRDCDCILMDGVWDFVQP